MNDEKSTYRKIEKIGEGAYGTVYKALNKETGDLVALKKIKFNDEDEGIPATTIREIIILKNLTHENIIELQEIIHRENKMYLVFEYMQLDLKRVLSRNKNSNKTFTYKEVLHISKQILEAIDFCHKRNIFHRDIKPQNILMDEDLNIKLADFGLARCATVPLRAYTQEIITLWYRPPELLLGTTFYDSSVDIWSIGCIMYELYTNQTLFKGNSETDQLHKIYDILGVPTNEEWPDVENKKNYNLDNYEHKMTEAFSNITDEKFKHILVKMLKYNPIERITAREILDSNLFVDHRDN